MHKKGFIFDLDGVIVDTAKYHYLAWKKLAESIGIDFNKNQNEQLKGVSRVASLKKILAWADKQVSDKEFEELLVQKNTDYLNYIKTMDKSEILPDVKRVLHFLKKNNQPIALGSASKNAKTILNKIHLMSKFDVIIDGNEVTKAKPNPEVFLKAAEQININPKNCIVFEDAIAGIQAANKAGMISVGIGNKQNLNEANYVFKDFTKINESFLKQLIKK